MGEKVEETLRNQIIRKKIGFIGGGNMCKAIVSGLMANQIFSPDLIYIHGPNIEKLTPFETQGNMIEPDLNKLLKNCDIIFLSVKPIMLELVTEKIKTYFNSDRSAEIQEKYLISILAGTTIQKIRSSLPPACRWHIIRVMPNTPMMLGVGSVVYSFENSDRNDYKKVIVETLLGSCSGVCELISESLINSAAAVSGSGPAYGYIMIEALADGGVKMGLTRDLAMKLAAQTLLGASKMVLDTGKHPGLLKDEVCSAGGTTICGVHALEQGGVRSSLINAVEAATNRAKQMEGSL